MWLFLSNSFLSIVDPEGAYDGSAGPVSPTLLVRARIKGDIEAVFPEAKVNETPHRDYRFRAMIDRKTVAAAMAAQVMNLGAGNFKGSVKESARHDAYMGVWVVMNREQERRVARKSRATRDLI